MAERNKMLSLKPSQIDFEPREKSKGRKGSAHMFHVKRTVKDEERRVSFLNVNLYKQRLADISGTEKGKLNLINVKSIQYFREESKN